MVNFNIAGLDGNAFALMTAFSQQAKKSGWTKAEIQSVLTKAQSGNYDNLVSTLFSYTS